MTRLRLGTVRTSCTDLTDSAGTVSQKCLKFFCGSCQFEIVVLYLIGNVKTK
jgi:hypothetical protein